MSDAPDGAEVRRIVSAWVARRFGYRPALERLSLDAPHDLPALYALVADLEIDAAALTPDEARSAEFVADLLRVHRTGDGDAAKAE